MRYSRSEQLNQPEGFVHKYWKCHNSEFLIKSSKSKNIYLKSVIWGLRKKITKNNVGLQALTLMDNHGHQILHYRNGVEHLSNYMRSAHTRFGRRYNDEFHRTGKVGNERPKTPLIQDPNHCMRVHCYVEANPVRAGICNLEQLKNYPYSSYSFYAHGFKSQISEILEIPEWYLGLGKTPKQRQAKYRKIFLKYLELNRICSLVTNNYFIGEDNWIAIQFDRIKSKAYMKRTQLEILRSNSPPITKEELN